MGKYLYSLILFMLISIGGCSGLGKMTPAPTMQPGIQPPIATLAVTSVPATSIARLEATVTRLSGQGLPGVTESISEATVAITAQPGLPACTGNLTSPNQEGPYYSPGSPERDSLLEAGMPGTPILITGRVFDQDCHPIPGAKVDFWQADVNGDYDNVGYRLRGHVLSDENGVYSIESIAPGLYTGRPAHIHVKVFAPDGRELLTTQLYFPGSEGSADVLAAPDLLVQYQGTDGSGRELVWFNFVVKYQ